MRDGASYSGTVVASAPSEIKLTGDDGVTRTLAMAQVRSVDYGEAPASPAPAPAPATAPPPAAATAQPPAAAPPPAATAPPPAATPAPASPPPASPRAAAPPASAPDASQPAPALERRRHPVESAVTTRTFTLPAGTQVPVRVDETIDSSKAVEGQTFAAEVTRDLRDAAGDVVVPRGANAHVIIRSASKGGKIRGAADLGLDLASVSIDGRRYELETVDLTQKGRDGIGANKRTGEFAGGGAAVGAIIGAIAGGGKGAAIGAGAGAGAGAVGQVLTKGNSVKVPAETILTFQLERALQVTAAR
jgi:hypothetical protein